MLRSSYTLYVSITEANGADSELEAENDENRFKTAIQGCTR